MNRTLLTTAIVTPLWLFACSLVLNTEGYVGPAQTAESDAANDSVSEPALDDSVGQEAFSEASGDVQADDCKKATCAKLGVECGTAPDSCGGTIECGECTKPNTCGGGGVPNHCGCTPSACPTGVCGTFTNGCDASLQCGCAAPLTCQEGLCCADAPTIFYDLPSIGTRCGPDAGELLPVSEGVGLDYTSGDHVGYDAGTSKVTSCVGFDFHAVVNFSSVTVRARKEEIACDKKCSPTVGEGCDLESGMNVYRSTNKADWASVGAELLTDSAADYTFHSVGLTQYIAVCRSNAGPGRQDVRVFGVKGTCVAP